MFLSAAACEWRRGHRGGGGRSVGPSATEPAAWSSLTPRDGDGVASGGEGEQGPREGPCEVPVTGSG